MLAFVLLVSVIQLQFNMITIGYFPADGQYQVGYSRQLADSMLGSTPHGQRSST